MLRLGLTGGIGSGKSTVASMLAGHGAALIDADAIARSVGTNPVVVRRVCGLLVRAGLVHMKKGQNGGALLTRAPEKISLGDIYRAVEQDPVLPVPQLDSSHKCAVGRLVGPIMRTFFGKAEDCMLKQLDKTRLSDLIAAVEEQKK